MGTHSWALVAHACSPNYLGGRDVKDRCLKPAQANDLQNPILKTPSIKKGWQSGLNGKVPA
jgi:hypothetical protein